jgi:DNA-binding IclR family transcriptional regulator
MGQSANRPIKSVVRTFAILNALERLDGAGVSDIADELDLPMSTVHSHLSTLAQEEVVIKEGQTYRVGVGILELGIYARERVDVYDIAKSEVTALADETGEHANLMVEEHGRGVYLQREQRGQPLDVDVRVGSSVPLHATALGKAILAHMPADRVDEVLAARPLEQFTPQTVTDREAIERELATVRETGVALDDEERVRGLRCVAAPILSTEDRILGSVSVSGPASRIDGPYFREELPDVVRETVDTIELNVTYP